ncbi:winged helix-turn-helix domain-containing protein [Flocculibacter collagenilyticus]|uniref:winged helix-turn-helix domain-containing protein n=1 Tax=Flocculibacter collagenilyticus TaxID=2744479 RepID=UPI0018F27CBB|nr:winged helix-turn-helix domain-containing protein [Flocculibacter collagenilyticus]
MPELRSIGNVQVDPSTNQIWIEGDPKHLPPKQMDLLLFFMDHPDQVISHDELLEALWPGRYGADESLFRAISNLRKLLGQSKNSGVQYIETIPKRGYRLCQPVSNSIIDSPTHSTDSITTLSSQAHAVNIDKPNIDNNDKQTDGYTKQLAPEIEASDLNSEQNDESHSTYRTNTLRNTLILASIMGVFFIIWLIPFDILWKSSSHETSAPPTSIAVLPFENFTNNEELDILGDGLAEEVLNELIRFPQLKVAARTSSFYFKDNPNTVQDIGDILNVHYVLDGSIRSNSGNVSVAIQLINTQTGYHEWSQLFDFNIDNLHNIQHVIAQHVVEQVGYKRDKSKTNQLAEHTTQPSAVDSSSPTPDPHAYAEYISGKQKFNSFNIRLLFSARKHFEEAISIDNDFVDAHIALANVLTKMAAWGLISHDSAFIRAKQHLAIAEPNSQNNPDYWFAHGFLMKPKYLVKKNTDAPAAIKYFKKALSLNPNHYDSLFWYGALSRDMRDYTTAIRLLNKAVEFDPLSHALHSVLISTYVRIGQFQLAEQTSKKIIKLVPEMAGGYEGLALVKFHQGEILAADQLVHTCLTKDLQYLNCWDRLLDIYTAVEDIESIHQILDLIGILSPALAKPMIIMKALYAGDINSAVIMLETINEDDLALPFISPILVATVALAPQSRVTHLQPLADNALSYINANHRPLFAALFAEQKGNHQRATQLLNQFIRDIDKQAYQPLAMKFNKAQALTMLGQQQQAIQLLSKLYTHTKPIAYAEPYERPMFFTSQSPFLNELKSHPDYAALLAVKNKSDAHTRRLLNQQRKNQTMPFNLAPSANTMNGF